MNIGEKLRLVIAKEEDWLTDYSKEMGHDLVHGYHFSHHSNHASIKEKGLIGQLYSPGHVKDFDTSQHLLWYSVNPKAAKKKFVMPANKQKLNRNYRFKLSDIPVKSTVPLSGADTDRLAYSKKSFFIHPSKIEVLNEKSEWVPLK